MPPAVSLILYVLIGFVKPEDTPERLAITERINSDGDGAAAAAIPTPAGGVEDAVGTRVKD